MEETTSEEEIDLANELLDAGYIELSKVCQPRFSFSLESIDATKQYEFKDQMRLLELGKIITIEKEEGLWYYPALLEISLNLDNSEEFSMTFANAMRLDDWGYTYADLISDASSTSRKVSANWQDILAYSKERAEISSLIKDPLDTTLRASFANMVNQEFTVDKNGILGRKKVSETSDEFEDEQVRLINNLLIFTDDNWETAKTALGKIYYTDEDGNQVTSYGLIAETIIGSLIMGERLKIKNTNSTVEIGAEGITIKKADGAVVLSAKPDGSLVVKGYATQESLDDVVSELNVAKEQISAKVSSTGGDKSSFAWSLTSSGFYLYSSSTSPIMSVTSSGAVFAGSLSAATGTFSGSLSAATGSFAGSLSAVTGTLGDLTVTGRLKFGGDNSYYIDANYNDSSYYVNLPGLRIDKASGAVFSGTLSAANGSFSGTITSSSATITGGSITLEASYTDVTDGSISSVTNISSSGMLLGNFTSRSISANEPYIESYTRMSQRGIYTWRDWNDDYYWHVMVFGFSDRDSTNYNHIDDGLYMEMGSDTANGYYARGICLRWAERSIIEAYMSGSTSYITVGASGCSTYAYGTWYNASGTTLFTGSDRNIKNTITDLSEAYSIIFDYLRPVSYKLNDGTSGRLHTGFIAQEVEEAVIAAGLTGVDFAGYAINTFVDKDGKTHKQYYLRYEEFIALCVREIQKLKARVAELENQ